MILLIDNYDSFTFNIFQAVSQLGARVKVVRNDAITISAVKKLRPEAIILSPGPGTPDEAGIALSLIETLAGQIPMLGVCLGHQAMGQVFGGRVVRAPKPMHGKVSHVYHKGRGVFRGLPSPLEVTRYHSLIVERESLPACLKVTAETDEGLIMGMRHQRYGIEGVQFHPESYATPEGLQMFQNFLDEAKGRRR